MSSEKKVSLILAFKTKPALERLAEQFVSYWTRYVLGKKYVEALKHCWEVKWIKRKYLFVIEKDSIQHIFSFHVKGYYMSIFTRQSNCCFEFSSPNQLSFVHYAIRMRE